MTEALAPPVGEVLTAETVKLLVKGDLLRHTASATDVEFLNVCGRTLSAMVLRKGRPYEAMFCNLTFLSRPSLAAPTVQVGEDLGSISAQEAEMPTETVANFDDFFTGIGPDERIGDAFLYRTALMGDRHLVEAASGFVRVTLPYNYGHTSNAQQRRDAEIIVAALTGERGGGS